MLWAATRENDVSWEQVRRQFNSLAHRAWRRRPVRAPLATSGLHGEFSRQSSSLNETSRGALPSARLRPLEESDEGKQQRVTGDVLEVDKARIWRRRGLQRKGANMRIAMTASVGEYSLAMLDEAGIVVAWYERAFIGNAASDDVVDDHVSQFYVLEDVVAGVPHRDMRVALANGSCTEHGWRRRAGGAVYWGTTVIQALVNQNGQLQGFSHLTRESRGPWQRSRSKHATRQRCEFNDRGFLQAGAFGVVLQGMCS